MRDRRPSQKFAKNLQKMQLFHENWQKMAENPFIKGGGDLAWYARYIYIYIYTQFTGGIYLHLPHLGAISHKFSHIRPEFGAKSTYICIYTPRVRDYIQQYSPEFGIYVFLTVMLEFPLNLSHFCCNFWMKNKNSTFVKNWWNHPRSCTAQ